MNAFLRSTLFMFAFGTSRLVLACDGPCAPPAPRVYYQRASVAEDTQPSWIFSRSTYTHDPYSGAHVAQYMRTPAVEPLEDERNVTSRYRRTRTNLRGPDGSIDSTYQVQAWGNGRGGLDAEWERFHDAWKESYLQNGYSNGPAWGGNQGPWGSNAGGWNNGFPGSGFPGGGWGGPGNWGPGNWNQQGPWNNGGGPWNNGGHGQQGNGGHGDGPHGDHDDQ